MAAQGESSDTRDVAAANAPGDVAAPRGRQVIVAIGIDRYPGPRWSVLRNAVKDAVGAAQAFKQLGFDEVVAPLHDGRATREAISRLVNDELAGRLHADDSLVVFYAGHGGVRSQPLGQHTVNTGYLVPVDAGDDYASWIELKPWLEQIARLPPRHILVILDACKSGIALSDALRGTRDSDTALGQPFSGANRKRSRLLITSADEGELALDHGPRHGHSLFTGSLIDVLVGGLGTPFDYDGRPMTNGSNLGHQVRTLVQRYPEEAGRTQTPVVGRFHHDEHGEMLIPALAGELAEQRPLFAQGSNQLPVSSEREELAGVAKPARWIRHSRAIWIGGALAGLAVVVVLLLAWRSRAAEQLPDDPAGVVRGESAEPPVSWLAEAAVDAGRPSETDGGSAAASTDRDGAVDASGDEGSGATLPAGATNQAATPPAAIAAPQRQVGARASLAAARPALCPTTFDTPRLATVEWKGESKPIPATLLLPCGAAAKLLFRQAHRVASERTVIGLPGQLKAKQVRLTKITTRVMVTSKPKGAQIMIKDRVLGTTPTSLKLAEAEPVTLSFSKSGYATLERQITPGTDTTVDVELTRPAR